MKVPPKGGSDPLLHWLRSAQRQNDHSIRGLNHEWGHLASPTTKGTSTATTVPGGRGVLRTPLLPALGGRTKHQAQGPDCPSHLKHPTPPSSVSSLLVPGLGPLVASLLGMSRPEYLCRGGDQALDKHRLRGPEIPSAGTSPRPAQCLAPHGRSVCIYTTKDQLPGPRMQSWDQ